MSLIPYLLCYKNTQSNKRKNREIEGTSSSVAMEDTLMPDQQQKFANTKCKLENDKPLLQWGDIYWAIKEKAYTNIIEEVKIKECDLDVWNNISKSIFNQAGARPCILPCAKTIKTMVKQADLENRWIANNKGQPIDSLMQNGLNLLQKRLTS